jgi:hypothetical protein
VATIIDAGPGPECDREGLQRFVEQAPTMPLENRNDARNLLLEMVAWDQCMRQLMFPGPKVDRHNTEQLKRFVDHYGWPTLRAWGHEAERAAFLIAQHADHDVAFQEKVLVILRDLKPEDRTPAYPAYLHDRIQVLAKKAPQRFGTQGSCVGTGVWQPFPIEDEGGVDVRRKSVGLAPLAEYVATMNGLCSDPEPPAF